MFRILVLVFLLLLCALPSAAEPGRVFFDGRLSPAPAKLSPAQETMFAERVAPEARRYWREQDREAECLGAPDLAPLDIATGAFLRPGAEQQALLYLYCAYGDNFSLNGLVILENGLPVAHFVYDGHWESNIGAGPDFQGQGTAAILIVGNSIRQGRTTTALRLLHLTGETPSSYGMRLVYEDDCGLDSPKKTAIAQKLSFSPGSPPNFFQETFRSSQACDKPGGWRRASGVTKLLLEKDPVELIRLK